MFLDNALAFQGSGGVGTWSTPQAITATADGTNVIDIMGTAWVTYSSQAGTPAIITGQNVRDGGNDYGTTFDGMVGPWIYMAVTTAATASANTVQLSVLAAPDSASGTYPNETHAPGSYTTIWTGPAWTGTALGKAGRFFLAPLPPTFIAVTDTTNPSLTTTATPRYYKITYTTGTGNAAALKVLSGLVVNPQMSTFSTIRHSENFIAV